MHPYIGRYNGSFWEYVIIKSIIEHLLMVASR